jgi:COMPASS component SPP1
MDPYEADPSKIPSTDLYGNIPHFGRYLQRPNDFKPDSQYIQSTTPESIAYWTSVLDKCTAVERVYKNETGGRDVFALGGVIGKSSHLKEDPGRDYELADANEVAAITLARTVLGGIRTPDIYFVGKVHNLLVSPPFE